MRRRVFQPARTMDDPTSHHRGRDHSYAVSVGMDHAETAVGIRGILRPKQNPASVRRPIRSGRVSLPRGHPMQAAAIHVHREDGGAASVLVGTRNASIWPSGDHAGK
jgi:hypothetical protein